MSSFEQKSMVIGEEMYDLTKKIFPYCRSITGGGR